MSIKYEEYCYENQCKQRTTINGQLSGARADSGRPRLLLGFK